MRKAKQERSQARQQRMAQAAAQLLIEEGPSAVTHRRVAEAAGLAPGSGNYYFPSKKELMRTAVAGAEDLRSRTALEQAHTCPVGQQSLTEVARVLIGIYFAPQLDPDVVPKRLNPILDAGHDPQLQQILRDHQPLLARALDLALDRMTGWTLAESDVEMLMQSIGSSLLYGAALGGQDPVAYAVRSVARLLELLGIRPAADGADRQS